MLMRRDGHVPGRSAGFLLVIVGATLGATLSLGSSSALAAGSRGVSASTLLSNACKSSLDASAFRVRHYVNAGATASSFDAYFGSTGELITDTLQGDQTVHVIRNGSSFYMEGNRSFWLSNTNDNAAAASLYANRWIDATSDQKDTTAFTNSVTKETVLRGCSGVGSVTFAGKATVNGVKVIKVHQAQVQQPGTFYIEDGPTPYILRAAGTSKKHPGVLVFSDYGVQPDTAAPPDAIPISELSGNSGSSG